MKHTVFGLDPESGLTLLVFAVFSVFLLAQHQLVFLYHDDYGVAVLDYPRAPAGGATEGFGLGALFSFLASMYTDWSGRVLTFLVLALSHTLGLPFFRITQTLIIVVIMLLVVAAASRAVDARIRPLPSLLAIAAFLTIPTGTLVNGAFWFTASVQYLWVTALVLAAVYMSGVRQRLAAGCVVLLSLAALAHEQVAVGTLAYAVLFVLLTDRRAGRDGPTALLKTLPIGAAMLTTALAPGNLERASAQAGSYAGSVTAKLLDNAGLMAERVFGPGSDNNYFVYVLLLAFVLLTVHAARHRLAPRVWLTLGAIAVLAALAILYQTEHLVLYMLVLVVAYTAALATVVLRQDGGRGRNVLACHLASVAVLVPVLLAPTVAMRTALPFFVLALVPLVYAFVVARETVGNTVSILLVALIGVKAIDNAAYVYDGFRANADVLRINDERMRSAAFLEREGLARVASIELYRIPRPRFAEKMPYDKPVVGAWMKKYYGLDQDVALTWQDPDTGS